MFSVTPEYRFDGQRFAEGSRTFADWNAVKVATRAYLATHEYVDEVFFMIEKQDTIPYLWVGFKRDKSQPSGWTRDHAWYGDDPEHFHYNTETPDGFGCPTCIYG